MPDIETARKLLTKLWKREDGVRLAYQAEPFAIVDDPDYPLETPNDRFRDHGLALKEQLFYIEKRDIGWDYYVPALIPHAVQGLFASAFGCEIRYWQFDPPGTVPLISRPEDIHGLKKPSIQDGLLSRTLELTNYLVDHTGGRYPMQSSEINAPLVVADQILGCENLLVAMYTHPQEIHVLLDMITELIIDFSQAQRSICGDLFVSNLLCGAWGPDSTGITVADDLLAVVSPNLYEEFGVPYNNRLSDAFGGLMVHSCGDVGMNLGNIMSHHNLRAVNFQVSEIGDRKAVIDALGSEVLFLPTLGLNDEGKFGTNAEYVDYILAHMGAGSRVLMLLGIAAAGSGLDGDLHRNEDPKAVLEESLTLLENAMRDVNGVSCADDSVRVRGVREAKEAIN